MVLRCSSLGALREDVCYDSQSDQTDQAFFAQSADHCSDVTDDASTQERHNFAEEDFSNDAQRYEKNTNFCEVANPDFHIRHHFNTVHFYFSCQDYGGLTACSSR